RDDQVEPTVVVVIDPRGRGDHPGLGEGRGFLERDVTKVPGAVVLEQIAARRHAGAAGHGPASDEQIEMAVAVEVAGHDARPALREPGQRQRVAMETTAA